MSLEEYLKLVNKSKVFYTVAEYFLFLENQYGIKRPDELERERLYAVSGLVCASICEDRNIEVQTAFHKKFGQINKYPEYIIAEAIFGKAFRHYFPLFSPTLARRYPQVKRRKPGT